jgi:hypothetical protein
MTAKGLTRKEQKFAGMLAAGATQAEAYAAAYSAEASKETKRSNGHRIAKKAHVAAEIKKLRNRPAVDDFANIKVRMIEKLLELSVDNTNSVAQHRAIVTLLKYADDGAERQVTKDLAPDLAALLDELTADAEVPAPLDPMEEIETVAAGDITETAAVQRHSSLGDDRRSALAKLQFAARKKPAHAAADANAEAFLAETKAHQESVRRSREEVQRLTALYRQKQDEVALGQVSKPATADKPVPEGSHDPSTDPFGRTEAYQASGRRPGYRREMIRGQFPPKYRWIPVSEADES